MTKVERTSRAGANHLQTFLELILFSMLGIMNKRGFIEHSSAESKTCQAYTVHNPIVRVKSDSQGCFAPWPGMPLVKKCADHEAYQQRKTTYDEMEARMSKPASWAGSRPT